MIQQPIEPAGAPNASSIVRRLMFGLTAIIGLSSVVAVGLFVAYEVRAGSAELERSVDASATSLAKVVEAPLWDLDIERAARMADAFAEDPRVVRLTVLETTNNARHVVERSAAADTVSRSRTVFHDGRKVGEVSVTFSRSSYRAAIVRQVLIVLGVSLLLVIAVAMGIRVLVSKLLNRPLTELSLLAGAYAAGDYAPHVKTRPYEEFQSFYALLQSMGGQIVAQLNDVHSANTMMELVMNSVPQSVFWKDREGRYLGCNSVFARAVGLASPEDVIGKTDFDLESSPVAAETYRAADQAVMQQKRPRLHIIEHLLQADGQMHWVDTTKVPLTDDNGNVIGLLGVSDDITERRHADEALHRRNHELAALNRFLDVAATEVAPRDLLTRACAELADILGVTQGAAGLLDEHGTEITIIAAHGPEGQNSAVGTVISAQDNAFVETLLSGKAPLISDDVPNDARLRSIDGLLARYRVRSMIALPLVVEGTAVGGIVLASTTTREFDPGEISLASNMAAQVAGVLARQRAHAAERLLRAAIEQGPESVVITDTAARIVYVNSAFSAITGYSPAEVLRGTLRVIKSGKHDEAFYREMWATLRAGDTWHGQITNRKKNGELFTEHAIIAPVRDERGEVTNYIAVKRDITRELQREEQLRHAQRMEAVGQLAGGIAHDFNNILAAMIMELEMLEIEHELPAAAKPAIHHVRASVDRAANLTRQLLMFSRRQALSSRPQDLNLVVADLLRMLMRVIGESIMVSFVESETPARFMGDAGMIGQVVMNLCVNARDAMPNGGRLTIKTTIEEIDAASARSRPGARAGRFACLMVSDTGSGMTVETQNRLFEPFFTTKDVGKGTGLGLATSHGIVAQHQGWIEVDSEMDKGSTFRVFLPSVHDATEPSAQELSAAPAGGSVTVLLVEDEALVREMVVRSLRRLGHRVVEAANGVEALSVWANTDNAVDLVLTDMVMPEGLSGIELSKQLRRLKPSLKVVVMSGYNVQTATNEDGLLGHDCEFLSKPFTIAELGDAVKRALAR